MYDILQLNDMLVPELLDIAEQLKIAQAKKLSKQDLIYKILDKQAVSASAEAGQDEEKPRRKRIVKTTTANSTEEAVVESTGEKTKKQQSPSRRLKQRQRNNRQRRPLPSKRLSKPQRQHLRIPIQVPPKRTKWVFRRRVDVSQKRPLINRNPKWVWSLTKNNRNQHRLLNRQNLRLRSKGNHPCHRLPPEHSISVAKTNSILNLTELFWARAYWK